MTKASFNIKDNLHNLRKYCKNAKPSVSIKQKYTKLIKEYIGLLINLIELLQRRGYVDSSILKLPSYEEYVEIAKSITTFTKAFGA